jgi:hypothetical protein
VLANEEIVESSGVAASWRRRGAFWTHNDSGDAPRLFAFDSSGKDLGTCELRGTEAIDWEDIASFEQDGKSWLLVGDVGDNGHLRKSYQLYLCEEPDPGTVSTATQRIEFRYEDGPHNCESIAIDAANRTVLLSTKAIGITSQVFQLSLPATLTKETLIARKIATIPVPIAVAMDISPDSRQAVVLTYGDAFVFSRMPMESWHQAFARAPRLVKMPIRVQGESVCFGCDGRSLYLTSEKRPAPLWEVPFAQTE